MIALSADRSFPTTVSVVLLVWASINGAQWRCLAAPSAETEAVPGGLAVNFTSKYGQRIVFSFHELYKKHLPLEMLKIARQYDVAVLEKFRKFLPSAVEQELDESQAPKWDKFNSELDRIGSEQARKIVEHCSNPAMSSLSVEAPFCKSYSLMRLEFYIMFASLMREAQRVARELELARKPRDYQQLSRMAVEMLDLLFEIYSSSPVAGYFDWTSGRINERAFTDYAVALLASLFHHGFGRQAQQFLQSLTRVKM